MEEQEVADLISHIVALQGRVDALTIIVKAQAISLGHVSADWQKHYDSLLATTTQKRLERIEGQVPRLAALMQVKINTSLIDQKLLDALRFDDDSLT